MIGVIGRMVVGFVVVITTMHGINYAITPAESKPPAT